MIPGIKNITQGIAKLQERQDKVMATSRAVVRLSGEAMANMHAKKYKDVKKQLALLSRQLGNLKKIEAGFEYYSMQAHQEFVEANVLYSIITTGKVPSMAQMKESEVNYLLGVMDAVGELKRECFEELREGNTKKAKAYYETMKGIYDTTLHMRFANSVLPNFRKKQDVARIQLESVNAELLRLKA
ncbi:MAG: hypothetical protein KGH53_02650 [Candidatus Micrarchaeota archaeon]|nr:hypothetical protein [Candidatus Micrarchaeota archaeon]